MEEVREETEGISNIDDQGNRTHDDKRLQGHNTWSSARQCIVDTCKLDHPPWVCGALRNSLCKKEKNWFPKAVVSGAWQLATTAQNAVEQGNVELMDVKTTTTAAIFMKARLSMGLVMLVHSCHQKYQRIIAIPKQIPPPKKELTKQVRLIMSP